MDGVLILAIETATACGSVSLSRGGPERFELVAECSTQPDLTHSRRLMGSVEWLLRSVAVSWEDIEGIGISLGPGSFTGLRIGLAAAKAIAMATGKPLLGVPTLDALALAAGRDERLRCCVLDARKQQVYAEFYRVENDGLPCSQGQAAVVQPRELLDQVGEPVVMIGSGAAVYQEQLAANELVAFLPGYLSFPRAIYVGMLAARMLEAGKTLDPAAAVPLYVRASEAEVNLRRKNRQQ